MRRILLTGAAAAVALLALGSPVVAGSEHGRGDYWKLRAECDKKLYEAKKRSEFYKAMAECDKKAAEFRHKQREEAIKAWREREKKWRDRLED